MRTHDENTIRMMVTCMGNDRFDNTYQKKNDRFDNSV
jgi:hypothetical protein